MVAKTFVVLFFMFFQYSSTAETLVEHYEELITEKIAEAYSYVLPTDASEYRAADEYPKHFGTYDFVIVGAGSTGSVIANRLSEIRKWRVLVLEAGTYPDEFTSIPAVCYYNVQSKYNWGYKSVPQTTACQGTVNQQCSLPRGKGIGGTSLLNFLIYSRGNRADYDAWSELLDDPSWTYDHLLPYFKKSEDYHHNDPLAPVDPPYHGHGGDLYVSYALPHPDIAAVLAEGAEEIGLNATDYNGEQQIGNIVYQFALKHGRRFDQGTAFIRPASRRRNLKVLPRSYVTKVEFDGKKQARGVIFTRDNRTYRVDVRKEVILSAGAIGSAQILLQSGVGPKAHLEEVGIEVVQDLPVGETLRDHVWCEVFFSTNVTSEEQTLAEQVEDFLNGTGTLTSVLQPPTGNFIKTSVETGTSPDLQAGFLFKSPSEIEKLSMNWTDDTYQSVYNISIDGPMSWLTFYLHPRSVGTLRLKSDDPFEYPLLDFNFLSDAEGKDIETMYQSIQTAMKYADTAPLRSINATLQVRHIEPCANEEFLSKEFWYCYIRQMTVAGLHTGGTCQAGTDPKTAVVDSDLKVFGVGKLRVADASVFPTQPSGNPNGICTMIGEKVSDVIKRQHGC